MNDAKQTPLTDLLRRVPHDMSVVHESPDQQGTMNTAIGRLMHDAADEIERLRAERDEYREAARTWENEAERRSRRYEACVDERDKLHDVLLSWDALIAYQFTGSRDAMNALQQCADETQAILGTNEPMEEQK